ncbi:hypothetical protein FNV43_RR10248 [Rhamnella rubrinervis]|uniref:Uncharacterized protein n=1 Tax=Rhamnella rubrinervis TaxID=2594499 RepID=A0A8K0HCT9_9ROSA|nr:hypothetical protein FNV43_RR10248 [Rhamnella rubrinervis]
MALCRSPPNISRAQHRSGYAISNSGSLIRGSKFPIQGMLNLREIYLNSGEAQPEEGRLILRREVSTQGIFNLRKGSLNLGNTQPKEWVIDNLVEDESSKLFLPDRHVGYEQVGRDFKSLLKCKLSMHLDTPMLESLSVDTVSRYGRPHLATWLTCLNGSQVVKVLSKHANWLISCMFNHSSCGKPKALVTSSLNLVGAGNVLSCCLFYNGGKLLTLVFRHILLERVSLAVCHHGLDDYLARILGILKSYGKGAAMISSLKRCTFIKTMFISLVYDVKVVMEVELWLIDSCLSFSLYRPPVGYCVSFHLNCSSSSPFQQYDAKLSNEQILKPD